MVHELDSMVEGTDAGGQPELLRGLLCECGVVDDDLRHQVRVGEADFFARVIGIACNESAFCSAEGGGDGDVVEESALFLVIAVGDGFGRVDGAATAYADEGIDGAVCEDGIGGLIELSLGSMLLDGGIGGGVVVWGEEGFDLGDEGGLGGEGRAGDDEGFGGSGRKVGEEVLLDGGRTVLHGLELRRLPETGERVVGRLGHGGGWLCTGEQLTRRRIGR